MTIKDIKEASNMQLISKLCFNAFKETKQSLKLQERICKELETRGVIESASELNDYLNN